MISIKALENDIDSIEKMVREGWVGDDLLVSVSEQYVHIVDEEVDASVKIEFSSGQVATRVVRTADTQGKEGLKDILSILRNLYFQELYKGGKY